MKVARSIASLLFVAGIALVLSLPILKADDTLTLEPIPFDGIIGVTSSLTSTGSTGTVEASLGSGELDGVPWDLYVTETEGTTWCFSYRIGPNIGDVSPEGNICTGSTSGVGPSTFIPASLSEGLDRGVLVAAVPSDVATLELKASNDATMRGFLFALPDDFKTNVRLVVVFLPPGADIAAAVARDESGTRVDLSRLVDQVDAY